MCITPSASKLLAIITAILSLSISACVTDGDTSGENPITPPVSSNQVTLNWDAPTSRSDGECLNGDLSGFQINYYGETGGQTNDKVLPMNDGDLSCNQTAYDSACNAVVYSCSHTVTGLDADTWNFVVQAYDVNDLFSAESNSASKDLN